jgi:glc operon protein GlcG
VTIGQNRAERLIREAFVLAASDFAGRPICVSVCDAQGFLVAFVRADGAPVRGIEIAQGKAYSAARMGVSTTAFLARIHREQISPSFFCDPRLTALPGGAVIQRDGRIIGAIGVSGLTSNEDQTIADRIAAA